MTLPSAHDNEPHYITRSGWLRAAVLGAQRWHRIHFIPPCGRGLCRSFSPCGIDRGRSGLDRRRNVDGRWGVCIGLLAIGYRARRHCQREAGVDRFAELEHAELVAIYQHRGLSAPTAKLVADELTRHDALGTHVRDELGLSEIHAANPLQAAAASGATFSVAGGIPLIAAALSPANAVIPVVLTVTILTLAGLGIVGAKTGGAPIAPSLARVVGWGIFAMLVTAGIGKLFGVSV